MHVSNMSVYLQKMAFKREGKRSCFMQYEYACKHVYFVYVSVYRRALACGILKTVGMHSMHHACTSTNACA